MSYDQSLTNFSADGRIPQIEYANEAVNRGLTSVAVRGKDCIIMGSEKKSVTILQEPRTIRKIYEIDGNTCLAQAGLQADARIMANQIRLESQSYSLNYDDQAPVDFIAKKVSEICKKYTTKGGARPLGIGALIGGFDSRGQARLFTTDPTGSCTEWKANAVGKSHKQVVDFLEKNYKEGLSTEEALKLCCRSMLYIVESGSKNIELGVITKQGYRQLKDEEVETLVANVNQ